MTDILETGSDWITEMNRAHRSRTVVYDRGEIEASVLAVVGRTLFRVPREYGLFEKVEAWDFLIEVSELVAFGEPEGGDQVKATLNGSIQIFEVMAPGDEPVFRYADPYRKLFRIHTKHIGAA